MPAAGDRQDASCQAPVGGADKGQVPTSGPEELPAEDALSDFGLVAYGTGDKLSLYDSI